MMKEMLIRGGIIIAGLMVTEAVLEKVERASLNRKKSKKKKEEEPKKTIQIEAE